MKNNVIMSITSQGWNFDNSYARLPELFYAKQSPIPVAAPKMAVFNTTLAEFLGLNSTMLNETAGAMLFAGNEIPEGAEPIAQAYAGHQFGHFTMLGDGRAILLGEQLTPDGKRFDIQLKGSGRTPFSRGGDGRAALGPMLREYIISEALYWLGIPATRSLAVVTTGEPVFRETPLPGAVLVRVASSHIRVGTFEYALARGNPEALRPLADYTIQRHYPELSEADNPYLAFLHGVIERQAGLVAKWQLVGFIHGVMNTDNMALSGEAIDFGPCAFMDAYDPATVFSSIDIQGRYAYRNQPAIAQWNLARFAETLLPLLHPDQAKALSLAEEAILTFAERYADYWLSGMKSKLGLVTEEAGDNSLIEALLTWMHQNQQDFTNTFRTLSSEISPEEPLFQIAGFADWYTQWRARLARQPKSFEESLQLMRLHNPAVIPRNHRVEEALKAAVEKEDFSVLQNLLSILETPYTDLPQNNDYKLPSDPCGTPYKTFCGT